MNYWPLLGIAVIVIGFLLRFNPVPVVLCAALSNSPLRDVMLALEISLRMAITITIDYKLNAGAIDQTSQSLSAEAIL